jgi:hypothetical protein
VAKKTSARRKSRFGLILGAALAALALGTVARADNISNSVDNSVDVVAEVMPLQVGGSNGTTDLYVDATNGDGKQGCNLTGSSTLVLSVSSNDTAVATVSPSLVTFTSCGSRPILTITPHSQGTATVSATQTSNNTGATFNLAPVTFTVNVASPPPANTPPQIALIGVTGGASYDKGSVPVAMCEVTDAQDGPSSFQATLSPVAGPYASDGIGQQEASCSYTDGGGLTASASVAYGITDPSTPGISYVVDPAAPDGNNGWYRSDVSLAWSVSEPESPNSLLKTGCLNQSITSDQAETTYGCSATSAGGADGPVEISIKRDATKPTISGFRSPAANGFGWNNGDVSVSFSCGDNLSGVESCLGDQTVAAEGAGQSATGNVEDNAGNTNSATVSGINIDRTDPTISGSASPAPNAAGWNKGDVSVAFDCDDDRSGVASCGPDATVASDGAGQSVTGTATDKADNSATATVSGINIDKMKPTIVGSIDPASGNGSNGWYVTAPTVAFTCTDELSGVASCVADGTGPASDQVTLGENALAQTVGGTATDVADNTETASVSGLKVDLSNPVVQCGLTPTFMIGQLGTVSASVTDAVSGAAAATVSAPATNSSGGSVSLTGYDNAGRSTTVSCPYHVIGATFLQPIDGRPTVNLAKLGRVIPTKVNLVYDGVPQTDLNTPSGSVTIGVGSTTCVFSTATDDVEAYAAGSSNSGLQFRWDPIGAFWIYNLDTSSFAMKPSTCYQASVYLNGTKAGYFLVKITK